MTGQAPRDGDVGHRREGMSDLHYGNNVKLTAGHMYKVVATVKGEKATFTFRA